MTFLKHRSTTTRRLAVGLTIGAAVAAVLAACATAAKNSKDDTPLQPATVDLPRYMGDWYVVANIPYLLEKDFVASRTHYALRADGKVAETFVARKGGFDGDEKTYDLVDTPDPATGNGTWRVRLIWPLQSSQITLYVDDDYQYTLIGYKDRSLGWIFARQPELSEEKYRELLGRFAAQGYDTSRFRRVPQRRDEIGRPGFHSPGDPT